MRGNMTFRALTTLCIVAVWCATSMASPPWSDLISLKRVNADPDKEYKISESNGPWMIMACSFSGEGAEKQAKELVYELRKRYKIPAYTYRAQFKLDAAPGRTRPKEGCRWQYNKYKGKSKSAIEEVGVLVGNYTSADDPKAQDTLKTLKYARPECLELKDGKSTNQSLTGWRMAQKQIYEMMGSEKKKLGPMRHAFVTTNPLLPPDHFTSRGLDPMIVALNKDVPYSLLDCPGKYTVQVATFKGRVVIKQDEIQEIKQGKQMKSELAEAAKKADALVRALRMKGYEAYQFHDRYASIVTVGSFHTVGSPRTDGRIEINPEIHKIMTIFGADPKAGEKLQNALKASGLDKKTMAMPVKSMIGITFDIQPIPVMVPKRPISLAREME